MTDPTRVGGLDTGTLFGKSQAFIRRGLLAQAAGQPEEYQLWASLALELLGKAALARVHPALVADPQHFQSLFAACGRPISPDIKTIGAKTVFERLSHLDAAFDKRAQRFCEQLSLRRNAELHSGESPFSGIAESAWHAPFWGSAELILKMSGKTLEDWVGSAQSETPRQILIDAAKALELAVTDKISRSQEAFESECPNPTERDKRVAHSKAGTGAPRGFEYELGAGAEEPIACPSCGGQAYLAGVEAEEIVAGADAEEPWLEDVITLYSVEELYCPVCKLHLIGRKELEAAGMALQFDRRDVRTREFEEEYMNE